MGRTDYFFDERDTPGSEKDTVNTLLLNFGFKSTGRKGKKGGGSSEEGRKALQNSLSGKTTKDGCKYGKY